MTPWGANGDAEEVGTGAVHSMDGETWKASSSVGKRDPETFLNWRFAWML